LFHPTTKWQQIDLWLKTLSQTNEPPFKDYAFLLREQRTIFDYDQIISSAIDQIESVTIDVVNENTITKLVFSYEMTSYSISVLKATTISSLLHNEELLRYFNLIAISPDDFLLVLEGTNEHTIIGDDIQQTVGDYSTTENQPIHFRITTSVLITKYDDNEQIKIRVPSRNITIEQLFQLLGTLSDCYKYLALNDTKRIVNSNEILSNLNTTKFILLRESQSCLICIEKSKNENYQQYALFASVGDIYKENQCDVLHQYLLYADDFVPSTETQLTSFRTESPIRFIIIDHNLPVIVTIENNESKQTIRFNCLPSMTTKRLCSISCQLFDLNNACYQLMMQDDTKLIDDDTTLDNIDPTMTEIQFQLTSMMSMCCSVTYSEQVIKLPCHPDTLTETIVKETLEQLRIPYNNIDKYELIAMNDDRSEIDFDISIDDIRQLFSDPPTMIPFELRKKDE
jgi:hypothetical protein